MASFSVDNKDDLPEEIREQTAIVVSGPPKIIPCEKGISLAFTGKWGKSASKEICFYPDGFKATPPSSEEGIITYCSLTFNGIGKKTAKKMYDKFGDNLIRVIETTPEKLSCINGISPKIIENIKESYVETKAVTDVVFMFSENGIPITQKKASAIIEKLGDNAIERIKDNPYILCRVYGFGFSTADALALNMKSPKLNSKERVYSCCEQIIIEAEQKGDSCILPTVLRDELLKRLPDSYITAKETYEYMKSLWRNYDLAHDDYNIAYRMPTLKTEKEIATSIVKMLVSSPYYDDEVMSVMKNCINKIQETAEFQLADMQKEAVLMALSNKASIITGGPGTGKSTILKYIIDVRKMLVPKSSIRLLAPTGRAARRMAETAGIEATTIHKFLGIIPSENGYVSMKEPDDIPDFVAVDEMSMVDMNIFDHLLKTLDGKAQIVLIGDPDQLPSIGAGQVLSDLISSQVIPLCQLDKIFRQDEKSSIVVNSRLIKHQDTNLRYDDNFRLIDEPNMVKASDQIVKVFLEEVDKYGLDSVQVLTPYKVNTECGSEQLNIKMQNAINPKTLGSASCIVKKKEFRVGDKVMQHKNTAIDDTIVCNGDIGYITAITQTTEGPRVSIDFNGEVCTLDEEAMKNISLAYTCTIHKSQGAEFSAVIMPIMWQHQCMLYKNLLYTGVSRAKKEEIIVGSKTAIDYAIGNEQIKKRETRLSVRIAEYYQNALSIEKIKA